MKMNASLMVFLLAIISSVNLSGQGVLHYELLPDSTVTPHDGATPTGPSESLTGSFSWSPVIPSSIADSMQFDITSLIFSSPSYLLALNNSSQPDNITKTGPAGDTALNAYVVWQGAPQNPYFIGGFGQGTYVGSAAAPSQLMLTEGLGPSAGGSFVAYVYIDAQLVPEPSTCSLIALVSAGLLILKARRKR